jgi:hypothetical protein
MFHYVLCWSQIMLSNDVSLFHNHFAKSLNFQIMIKCSIVEIDRHR